MMGGKVTMIIGEPCVGKSWLVQELLRLGEWEFKQVKWVPYHMNQSQRAIVVGRYDEPHQYPGTDRLSMAVQNHAWNFIDRNAVNRDWNILFEGDRLGNWTMIHALHMAHQRDELDFKVYRLWLRPEFLEKRRAVMRPNQNPEHWRRCKTKVQNIHNRLVRGSCPYESVEMVLPSDSYELIAKIRKERFN